MPIADFAIFWKKKSASHLHVVIEARQSLSNDKCKQLAHKCARAFTLFLLDLKFWRFRLQEQE
ncbi:hypothetical protein B7994_04815 [Fibrobacter sp. UWR2]|nr:hypothetical protein B7994_04815 [Fibrobacter sp. UWR2]